MLLGQNQSSYSTLLGERNSFLNPFYVGAYVTCFPVFTLPLHIVFVMACSVQHCLAELGGNLVMCHLEARQKISNMDVVWTTPWIGELNNSSMCWRVAPVLGRGMEWFTLSSRWESQSTPGGRLTLRLVELKSSDPSNAQSLELRFFPLGKTSWHQSTFLDFRTW